MNTFVISGKCKIQYEDNDVRWLLEHQVSNRIFYSLTWAGRIHSVWQSNHSFIFFHKHKEKQGF